MTLILAVLRQQMLFRVALLICVSAVSYLAFSEPLTTVQVHNDKLNHYIAFATLAFLLDRSWRHPVVLQLLFLACYGGAIELIQGMLSHRTASWADLGADMFGACSYYLIARFSSRMMQRFGYA